ncbi:MAG: hypothetical protein IPK80_34935 [Nannocystis sp.]|nr:hypothetical protein [Nannocystis sp.]
MPGPSDGPVAPDEADPLPAHELAALDVPFAERSPLNVVSRAPSAENQSRRTVSS